MSARSLNAALATRDLRSTTLPAKRDRDATEKWAHGVRPLAGLATTTVVAAAAATTPKVRPEKRCSEVALHSKGDSRSKANHAHHHPAMARKAEASATCASPLSRSLLDLLPLYTHHVSDAVTLGGGRRDGALDPATSPDVLYSFDRRDTPGKPVALDDLVARAERQWEDERLDRLVQGEWEVLDAAGERVPRIGKTKRGGAARHLQARSNDTALLDEAAVDEDGFELL